MAGEYLEGCSVAGTYMGKYNVQGVVRESRVELGGQLIHYVDLDMPALVRGRARPSVILDDQDIVSVQKVQAKQ